jgi:uncharacterized protein (DUF885 family)
LMFTSPAYFEGWAIYAEQLSDELGLFDGNPLAEIGYLQSLLVRVARQIVDTGIHHLRWSRERAIQEFGGLCGDAPEAFEVEVDRMCVQPGLMPGHALGWSTITGLRDKAKAALRSRFSLAFFHDSMLKRGPLPLSVLAKAAALDIAATKNP